MFTQYRWGIEIEMTGLTRQRAAEVARDFLGGTVRGTNVTAPDGRVWQFVRDGSIRCEKKENGRIVPAGGDYSVEMVSPILTYDEDMETLQELVRRLKRANAHGNSSAGIHLHLDGQPHSPRSLRNFINIIASKNDLLYSALEIDADRMRYCKKLDADLVERMNRKKPKTFEEIKRIWYEGYRGSTSTHYHQSRYHFAQLHSFFSGNGTIELRGFNSGTLHCGKIRAYVALALALNHQALTQKCANARKVQADNPKYAMRCWLLRLGFIGDEFKHCREHLCKPLPGDSAFRHGRP